LTAGRDRLPPVLSERKSDKPKRVKRTGPPVPLQVVIAPTAGAKEERQAREQASRFGRELRAASAQGERAARAIDRAAQELAEDVQPARRVKRMGG
jgi:hypothetical protein